MDTSKGKLKICVLFLVLYSSIIFAPQAITQSNIALYFNSAGIINYNIPMENEWVAIYDEEYVTGSTTEVHYGLTPEVKTKYIIDLEWENSEGLNLGIGGVKLRCYANTILGIYYSEAGELTTAFSWNTGGTRRVTISVESDTTLRMAHISANGDAADLPFYYSSWSEDQSSNIFAPDTVNIRPVSGAVVKVYRLTQLVNAPNLVTSIGSTKYQALGYDGPRARNTVEAGFNEIRNANMNATLFMDVSYMGSPTYVSYLKTLISDGWELGIHLTEWGLDDWIWEDAQTEVIDQYNTISNEFGTPPLSFCLLGIGRFSDPMKTQWVVDNLDMFQRGWRTIPQSLGGSQDLLDVNIDYWMGAADTGVATIPVYAHETEVTPADSASISANLFDAWLASIILNGVKLTGYNKWYEINSNQVDATFQTSIIGNYTTIIANTNGYPANILVKVEAASVTEVTHNGQDVVYSSSPDGFIIFEVENGETYTVSTSTSTPDTCSLDVNIVGKGSVTKTPDKPLYQEGETVTLTPTPDTDYIFYSWSGNGLSGRTSPFNITINGDVSITANFAYVVNEQYGIYLYQSLDGSSTDPAVNPYLTPYFIHGPLLNDYPVFRVVGTETTKPIGTGITLSNVIIDDDWYGTQSDRDQFFGIRGYPATFASTIIDGSGNSIYNCTLRNSIRYGLTTFGAENFYLGYNTVESAQYCISGNGAINDGGLVEYNYLSGMLTNGIKIKNWQNVVIQNNYVDLTPIHADGPSPSGINFSDDLPNVNENILISDNDFVRLSMGLSRNTYGVSTDADCILSGNEIINNRFTNTIFAEIQSSQMTAAIIRGDNFIMTGNVFTECQSILDYGLNNIITPNVYQ